MKHCFLLFVLYFAFAVTSLGQEKKILFIGIDGCRWDAIEAANTPAIHALLPNSIHSQFGLTEYKTWSGTGWSNMLTGVWHTEHGVSDNTFSGNAFDTYSDFISRAENYNPALNTISVVHWAPINQTIIQNIDDEITVGTDALVKDSAISQLTNHDPDILFVDFDDVDHSGHSFGFGPDVFEYLESIETTDTYIAVILASLYNRPNYNNEDWLIVLTTDHGGTMSGHGGGTLEERTIFNVFNNPGFNEEELNRITAANSIIYNEAFFHTGAYAQPSNQIPFAFGSTQDFTIEFWIKATNYTSDPAFVSNKDWDSGLNEGFVISAEQGQFWKVNIGDGNNRLDVHGGFIEPGSWHHLAVSFDRDGLMTAYEDGIIVGFERMNNIGNIDSGLSLRINQDGTGNYGYDFDGSYRDIRIWNTVIPQADIISWANNPITSDHPFYQNLLANWKCEDGSGLALQDSSPNANHCTIMGTVDWGLSQTADFTVYDYASTPRQPDNAVTALTWMCVPINPAWGLQGISRVPACLPNEVQTITTKSEITLFPNPTQDNLLISLNNPTTENLDMSIYDSKGIRIKSSKLPAGQTSVVLSLEECPSGIFTLQISHLKKVTSYKIIKL